MSPAPRKKKSGIALLNEIAAEASDPEFRLRLIEAPEKVLRQKGIEIPRGVKVVINVNRPDLIHLALPADFGDVGNLESNDIRAISYQGAV